MTDSGSTRAWTLLTGHGHVLVEIAKNPRARIRDLSRQAGLTERATQSILNDLESAGYITRHRSGNRTTYTIHTDRGFRHQSQDGLMVGPFLLLLAQAGCQPAQERPGAAGHQLPSPGRPTIDQDESAPDGSRRTTN